MPAMPAESKAFKECRFSRAASRKRTEELPLVRVILAAEVALEFADCAGKLVIACKGLVGNEELFVALFRLPLLQLVVAAVVVECGLLACDDDALEDDVESHGFISFVELLFNGIGGRLRGVVCCKAMGAAVACCCGFCCGASAAAVAALPGL